MNRAEHAVQLFKGEFNCSQSVFSAFSQESGLDRETASRIATPFGGGMSHMREVCGAVTGALMVIGLRYGMSRSEEIQSKEKTYALSQKFCRHFLARNNSLHCHELIRYDLGNPDEYEAAKRENVFDAVCTKFIKDAIEILEDLLR